MGLHWIRNMGKQGSVPLPLLTLVGIYNKDMKYKTWRERAAPIISEVIAKVGTDDMKSLRAALREAYPFDFKSHYPYKTWLDEIRRQLLLPRKPQPEDPNQLHLFKEP